MPHTHTPHTPHTHALVNPSTRSSVEQSAARGPRTLEWLVAFVGLHRPREVMDHLLASIFSDVVEGRATSHPLSSSSSSSSSTTTSSTASSSSLSPACFGVHAIEYLAQRHPQHCVDALRAHWARFLRYTAADHAKGDTHLLGFFALVASACPTATQLALPLVLGSLSMATLDRVITREADLPSHRPGNMSRASLLFARARACGVCVCRGMVCTR
jgi:hypothetical protein